MTNTNGIDAASNGRGSDLSFEAWLHFMVERPTTGYCHVTFGHPPINTITATTVAEPAELVGLIGQDGDLNVVVFSSANPDFYLAHYDFDVDFRAQTDDPEELHDEWLAARRRLRSG